MDIRAMIEVLWYAYTNYPMLPFVGTGVLTITMLIVTPVYLLIIAGALIHGRIQRGSPIPWRTSPEEIEAERQRQAKISEVRDANLRRINEEYRQRYGHCPNTP